MALITLDAAVANGLHGASDAVLYGLALWTTGRVVLSALRRASNPPPPRKALEAAQLQSLNDALASLRHPFLISLVAIASAVKLSFALGTLFDAVTG